MQQCRDKIRWLYAAVLEQGYVVCMCHHIHTAVLEHSFIVCMCQLINKPRLHVTAYTVLSMLYRILFWLETSGIILQMPTG